MPPAAARLLLSALLLPALGVRAQVSTVRAAPARPAPAAAAPAPSGPLAIRKIGGLEYVNLAEAAARLGLRVDWLERGRRLRLTGPGTRAELEHDTREITVNGLRVFLGDPILDGGAQLYASRVDFERSLAPLLRPGYGLSTGPLKTIVLDPGHGGKDQGTSANEKTFALDVARRARKVLEAAGYRVVLTRDNDVFLDLPQRAAIANANRASLFASVHFNALPNDRKTSGVEVFTFAPQFQRSTNSWSPGAGDDTEKEASPVNRHDLGSALLAHALQRRFVADLRAFDRGKKIAHWGVLRQLNCPGVLIECGFLTSPTEARKIASPAYRQKLAETLAAGIRDYAAAGDAARGKGTAAANRRKRAARDVD